jgi:putative phage-type endonuclease
LPIQRRPFDPEDAEQREQWLAWRRQDITGSVIAALFGVHPYATALRLYAEKCGVEFPAEENAAMRRGRWLEPAVAKAVRELRPEWKIDAAHVYLRDPDLKLGATPDFFIHGDPRGLGVLQIKTCAPSVFHRDWQDGREPPLWVVLQASVEAMLANAAFAAVACLLVDPILMDLIVCEFPRNPAAERKIIDAVRLFWQHVEQGEEPDPDFQKDKDVIRALVPRETLGKTLDLTGNNLIPALLDRRAEHCAEIKEREEKVKEIEAEIMHAMGDAELATGLNGWRVSYKTTSFKAYNVQARQSRILRIYDRRLPEEKNAP